MPRGTCHMLSESGLKQKPVNASRPASQPASQTLPIEGEGSTLQGVEVVVCAGCCMCAGVCLCVCMVEICRKLMSLKEDMVAVATL